LVYLQALRQDLLLKCALQQKLRKNTKIPLLGEGSRSFKVIDVDKYKKSTISTCHRLNGSSSPVLTATSLSYGKAKNSTPHRIKTTDLIEIKFGTVDYVG